MTDVNLTRRTLFTAGAAGVAAAAAGLSGGAARAAAPIQGPLVPDVRRFMIGGFEVTTLRDGAVTREGPYPIFGQNQTPEAVAELAKENLLPAERMVNGYTPTLVNTGAELILFDAGVGARGRPDSGHLLHALERAGHTADQIDVVVITHMHPDHIGGLMEDGAPAFPNARYVTGRTEFDTMVANPPERLAALIESNVKPLADRMTFLEPGDAAASGIEAVEAFGHTPGHLAFHVESDGGRLMITADAANHFVASLQRPDWHVSFDMDKQAAAATRKSLFGMIAAERLPFVGYHMPSPAVGYVEAMGQGFRYVPESYQLAL